MTTKCPQCGAPIDNTASNCKYCGEKLNPQPVQVTTPTYAAPQPSQQPTYQEPRTGYVQQIDPGINPSWPIKNKTVAGLLAIFLGSFGIHKFYMGRYIWGIIYLLFCWSYIPALIAFIEGLIYFIQSEHNFQVKNKVRTH